MGFQTYIFCSKVPSKCRKCRFRNPNFKKFPRGIPPAPLQLCRHYGLPLTKLVATKMFIWKINIKTRRKTLFFSGGAATCSSVKLRRYTPPSKNCHATPLNETQRCKAFINHYFPLLLSPLRFPMLSIRTGQKRKLSVNEDQY